MDAERGTTTPYHAVLAGGAGGEKAGVPSSIPPGSEATVDHHERRRVWMPGLLNCCRPGTKQPCAGRFFRLRDYPSRGVGTETAALAPACLFIFECDGLCRKKPVPGAERRGENIVCKVPNIYLPMVETGGGGVKHDLLSFGRVGVYLRLPPSHDQGTMRSGHSCCFLLAGSRAS